MKKLISLVLVFSILSCNFSVLANGNYLSGQYGLEQANCWKENVGVACQNRGGACVKENTGNTCEKDKNSGQFSRVVKAVVATGIVLGTFAGVKIAAAVLGVSDSKLARFAGKTFVGVAGTCVAIASIINSGTNLGEVSIAAFYGDTGKVNQFCFGINMVNIVAALYTLKYILSGQVFSGNSFKINIGLNA